MDRIDEGVAFLFEDDAGHEENGCARLNEPCISESSARIHIGVGPSGNRLRVDYFAMQGIGIFEGYADLMFGDSSSRVNKFLQHCAGITGARVHDGTPRRVPAGAVYSGPLPACGREA
jgi:hypothetical protein